MRIEYPKCVAIRILTKTIKMEKKFVIDYDNKVLTLHYQGQVFMFDLTMGDVGDFWYGFVLKDGTILDVNYHQEDADDVPFCEIWGTDESKPLNTQQIDGLDICEILGNPINYFGEEPIQLSWMNAFELDKQFTNFKIR